MTTHGSESQVSSMTTHGSESQVSSMTTHGSESQVSPMTTHGSESQVSSMTTHGSESQVTPMTTHGGDSQVSPTTTHICRVIKKILKIHQESVKIVSANMDTILVHESIKIKIKNTLLSVLKQYILKQKIFFRLICWLR